MSETVSLTEFRRMVSNYAALEEDSDFVGGAILREFETYGRLRRSRVQAVAAEALRHGRKNETVEKRREFGPNPDSTLRSKAFAKRLEPWARELREEIFDGPDAPFPGDLTAAANWIEEQVAIDRARWTQSEASRIDADQEIKRLADLTGLVVSTEPRFLKYAKPEEAYQKMAGAYPGTDLERLARETDRVSKKSPFWPSALTGFVLAGIQPTISRVLSTRKHMVCEILGDRIPSQSITLEFNAADVSYEEVRELYAKVREFFGVTDAERLHEHEFDFIYLVDSLGGPTKHSKTRFWEEVLRRWKEEPVYKTLKPHEQSNSWQAVRNKYERLDKRRGLRELATPNPPMSPAQRKQWLEAVRKQSERLGPPKLVKDGN